MGRCLCKKMCCNANKAPIQRKNKIEIMHTKNWYEIFVEMLYDI